MRPFALFGKLLLHQTRAKCTSLLVSRSLIHYRTRKYKWENGIRVEYFVDDDAHITMDLGHQARGCHVYVDEDKWTIGRPNNKPVLVSWLKDGTEKEWTLEQFELHGAIEPADPKYVLGFAKNPYVAFWSNNKVLR